MVQVRFLQHSDQNIVLIYAGHLDIPISVCTLKLPCVLFLRSTVQTTPRSIQVDAHPLRTVKKHRETRKKKKKEGAG